MSLLDYFLNRHKNTANIAKTRLQIIIAEQKKNNVPLNYFPTLKKEILEVIYKHIQIDPKKVKIEVDQKHDDVSILELNIIFSK